MLLNWDLSTEIFVLEKAIISLSQRSGILPQII